MLFRSLAMSFFPMCLSCYTGRGTELGLRRLRPRAARRRSVPWLYHLSSSISITLSVKRRSCARSLPATGPLQPCTNLHLPLCTLVPFSLWGTGSNLPGIRKGNIICVCARVCVCVCVCGMCTWDVYKCTHVHMYLVCLMLTTVGRYRSHRHRFERTDCQFPILPIVLPSSCSLGVESCTRTLCIKRPS